MKRNLLKMLSGFAAVTLLLSACGGGSTAQSSAASSEAQSSTGTEQSQSTGTGENVTLKLYANYSDDQEKDTLDRAIDA